MDDLHRKQPNVDLWSVVMETRILRMDGEVAITVTLPSNTTEDGWMYAFSAYSLPDGHDVEIEPDAD